MGVFQGFKLVQGMWILHFKVIEVDLQWAHIVIIRVIVIISYIIGQVIIYKWS